MNQLTDATLHSLRWDDVTLLLTFRVWKPKKSSCFGTAAVTTDLKRCFNVAAWPSKLHANYRKLFNGTAASLSSPGLQITLIQVVQLNAGPAHYRTTAERQMTSFARQILAPTYMRSCSPSSGRHRLLHCDRCRSAVESNWNVMAHGDAREGKWKGNWRMELVASTLHTTSEHGVSSITTADAHNSAASSRLNWRPRRFKWTRPFRRKTKSGFCACAITF